MIISFYINFNGKNSVIYFSIFNFFQFLHNKLFIFFNYNLLLFLIFIYCILLYVCALEHGNLWIVRYTNTVY